MERILALCHNDLDGIAASVALNQAHPEAHVCIRYVDYGTVNQALLKGLEAKRSYDRIILADISFEAYDPLKRYADVATQQLVNQQLPAAIVAYTQAGGELVLLDHHPRALHTRTMYANHLHPDSITETQDAQGTARAGSELAGRYFCQVSGCDNEETTAALLELMELAGEYDTWRNPHGYGGLLAMAVMLMHDPHLVKQELELALLEKTLFPEFSYALALEGSRLADYVQLAEAEFEAVLQAALATRVVHSPLLTEVHVTDYPSLIAERVYMETRGVVLVRYQADRLKADKISLRRHPACAVDLNALLNPFGGGGHAAAAGLKLKPGELPELAFTLANALTAVRSA